MNTSPQENKKELISFSTIEKLKRWVDEQYYQLRLLGSLSMAERQKHFSRYSFQTLLDILAWLRHHEFQADLVYKKILFALSGRVVELLKLMEKERTDQIRLGIYQTGPVNQYEEHMKYWKTELIRQLKHLSLPPTIEQRLTMAVLKMKGLESDVVSPEIPAQIEIRPSGRTHGTRLIDYRLEELFYETFASEEINRNALFEFLESDTNTILDFLEWKIESGSEDEKVNALELVRFIPQKKAVILISRAFYHAPAKISSRAKEILYWLQNQNNFSKFHQLISFLLEKIEKKDQLKKMEIREKGVEEEKKELYREYFLYLKNAKEEDRAGIIKKFGPDEFKKNKDFIETVFNKDTSAMVKSLALKNIAMYRIEELFHLFESAFDSKDEKLIYHAILYVRDYSIFPMVEKMGSKMDSFSRLNRDFAAQVVRLLG